eukprot:COSAG06_NODE_20066_length_810_cov_1.105485_1_plen_79_part_10
MRTEVRQPADLALVLVGVDVAAVRGERAVVVLRAVERRELVEVHAAGRRAHFLSFPYLCPEPVLAKMITFWYKMAQKTR